jgi:hypothetical protein
MQILPNSTLGGSLGSALGTGLSQLADLKLAKLTKQYDIQQERSQFAQGLAPVLGKNTANFLSNLGPDERKQALQKISSLMQLNRQPGQQTGLEDLSQQVGQNQQPSSSPEQAVNTNEQLSPQRAQLLEDIFTSPQEKRERKKLELIERQANLKETKPYVDSLKAQEKAARESDLRLKRMEALIERGNLPNAVLWTALTQAEETPLLTAGAGAAFGTALLPGVGTAIGGLVGGLFSPLAGATKSLIRTGSPDIEEFEKLSNDFVKNAKQFFGSRITDADLRVFMKTLPTLMQTDKGKRKVIDNLRSLNELSQIEAKAARSIIRNNGGVAPVDIEQQVKDKISKKVDAVAKEFISR